MDLSIHTWKRLLRRRSQAISVSRYPYSCLREGDLVGSIHTCDLMAMRGDSSLTISRRDKCFGYKNANAFLTIETIFASLSQGVEGNDMFSSLFSLDFSNLLARAFGRAPLSRQVR